MKHRGELSWGVHPSNPRRRLGTRLIAATLKEASARGFTKAEVEAAKGNLPSVRLAMKCGFKVEGVKKRGIRLDNGRYEDTIIFGKAI